jgi:sporulation protein YlmC with PRC-barrel domain
MDLVRDVMDKKLVDRKDCEMGRVDGLVMHVGPSSQPRITHIVVGGSTPWMRLGQFFSWISPRLSRLWGPKRAEPVRIPWSRVKTVGKDLKLDVTARDTGAIDWEIWIAQHIIEHIPGSGTEEEE